MTDTEKGASVRFPPPLVFVGFTLAALPIHGFVLPLLAPMGLILRVVAGTLIGSLGLALLLTSFGHFKRTGQDVKPWSPTPEIVSRGPYRFSRNPMYVGLCALQMGLGLASSNLWIVLLALPALAVVHFIAVRPEEAYLESKFGEGYLSYKSSVRRYL